MKKISLSILFAFFLVSVCTAQTNKNIDKAWDLFYKNKRDSAESAFNKIINLNPQESEAYLGLTLINDFEDLDLSPVRYFNKFCSTASFPDPYLYALWGTSAIRSTGFNVKGFDNEELNAFKKIIDNAKTNSTIKAMACNVVGNYLKYSNHNDWNTYYNKIGSIEKWQLLGDFENISSSGFDKNYEVISKPDLDQSYVNKLNVPTNWFSPIAYKSDHWVDLTNYYNFHNSIVFSQTFVNSPIEQIVQFRLGVSGSVKAWLNDMQILSESEERNNDIDTYQVRVKLHKGYNRILLQLGESYAGRMNFLLRLTDDSGNPIGGIETSQDAQPYSKEILFKPEVLPFFAEEYFMKQIKLNPKKPINYILLSQVYLQQDRLFEASRTLKQVGELIPSSVYLHILLSRLYQKENNQTFFLRESEKLISLDPNYPTVILSKFLEYIKNEQYQQAESLIPVLLKKTKSVSPAILHYIVALRRNDQKESMLLLDSIYNNNCTIKNYYEAKYKVELNVKHDANAALNVVKKYLKNHYDWNFNEILASYYMNQKQFDKGISLIKAYEELDPNESSIAERETQYYYDVKKYDLAKNAILKALAIFPSNSQYNGDLGTVEEALGNNEKAIQAYEKAILYNPGNIASIKALRKVKKEADVFSLFKEDDLESILKKQYSPDKDQAFGSVYLLHEEQKVVYSGGTSEERYRYIVRILNKSGVENWKEFDLNGDLSSNSSYEKAEIIKPNGNKIHAEINDEKAVFTNLEVGDVVHLVFKKQIVQNGKLSSYFWDKFNFSSFIPTLSVKYQLLIPSEQKFAYKMNRMAIEPIVSTEGGFKKYVWKADNFDAIVSETAMPALCDVGAYLAVSSIPSWTFVSNWYHDMASSRAKIDYEVKEVADSIFKNKITELSKIKAIYEFITSKITYSYVSFRQSGLIPQKPSTVINTRIGDCKDVSTLFLTLCKAAGIKANLLLVDTHDNGTEDLLLPSIDFNHCMAKAVADGHTYILELTSNTLPFGSLPSGNLYSRMLEVSDHQEGIELDYLNPANRILNQKLRKGKLQVQGLDLKLEQTNVFTGCMASELREMYREKANKEQEKLLEKSLGSNNMDVKINSLNFSDLNKFTDSANYRIAYRIHDALTSVGPVQFFSIPWADKADISDIDLNEGRKFPLELSNLNFADISNEDFEITIPQTMKVTEIPKSVSLNCKNADYHISYVLVNKKLKCSRNFIVHKSLVPKEDMDQFFAFYRGIIKADHEKLVLGH